VLRRLDDRTREATRSQLATVARPRIVPAHVHDDVIAELPGVLARLGAVGPVGSLGGVAGGPGASFGVGDELDPSDSPAVPTALRNGLEMFDAACEQLALSHGGFTRAAVVTDEMLQRELTHDPESYLGVTEVTQELGVSRQPVTELRTMGDFPEPVAHLAAAPVWRSSTLRRFVENWERKPGRPRKIAAAGSG
jgi:predicted DNA-binding transcriptional regulator AlpA